MTEWGPFFLTDTNAPFVPVFIRTVDRALHHAGNVWRQLARNVSNNWALSHLEPGSVMHTHDRVSKYEIEAFIGAVVGVTEANLIGVIKNNRLGKSLGLGPVLIQMIRQAALDFDQLGTDKKWHTLRHSVYHLNPNLRDWGFTSSVVMRGTQYAVELPGIYHEDGRSLDLVAVFEEVFDAFTHFVENIRDMLLAFSFAHIAIPANNHYYWATDELGNMHVCLGPTGFKYEHFPETAADFVGPLRRP